MRILILLIFLLSINFVSAEIVHTETVVVEDDSFHKLEFTLLQNATLVLNVEVSDLLKLMVLNQGNYTLWTMEGQIQTYYFEVLNATSKEISLDFDNIYASLKLYFVFVNTFGLNSELTYSLDVSSIASNEANFPFFGVVPLLAILIRRKILSGTSHRSDNAFIKIEQ